MAHLKSLLASRQCQHHLSSSIFVLPSRSVWYKPDGAGMTKKKKRARVRIPINWRQVNFNPAKIPSAWKPTNYNKKHQINYDRKKELAKHIPGYKLTLPAEERDDYHDEAIYVADNKYQFPFGLNQVLSLTKSYVVDNQLPESITTLAQQLWKDEQNQSVIDVMQRVHLFDFDPDTIQKYRKTKWTIRERKWLHMPSIRTCTNMAWEFIRLSNVQGFKLKSCDAMQRMLVESSPITTSFERANLDTSNISLFGGLPDSWKVQFQSRPAIQALSESSLECFATAKAVEESKNEKVISIYPALPISDCPTTNNYNYINETGFSSSIGNLHTLVEYNTEQLPADRFHATMFKSLFSALHSKACQLYGDNVEQLENPLTAQCIGLDGKTFHFMCLQLNSTSFNSDDGIKNMVWMSEPMSLFDECSHETWRNSEYYTGFDPQAFITFQAMWLNGIV